MTEHEDDLLPIPLAAKRAKMCQRSLYNWMNRGEIAAVKIGRRTFIWQSEIARFLKKREAYEPRVAA